MKNSATNHERVARLIRLSKEKYGLEVQADWRHRIFFDFLQISPSYRLAHQVATGGVVGLTTGRAIPRDFLEVVKTYEAFGDVWQTDYWTWWVRRAQYQFGTRFVPKVHRLAVLQPGSEADQQTLGDAYECLDQYLSADRVVEGNPGSLVLAIPLHLDRKAILKEVLKQLDDALRAAAPDHTGGQFEFLRNKIRSKTLDDARKVAWARAASPNKPLYVIGNRVRIAPSYVTEEGLKLRGDNRRELMVIVVSRHLRRALVYSENAARGLFPCADEIEGIAFDFEELKAALISHRIWMKRELARLKRA